MLFLLLSNELKLAISTGFPAILLLSNILAASMILPGKMIAGPSILDDMLFFTIAQIDRHVDCVFQVNLDILIQ